MAIQLTSPIFAVSGKNDDQGFGTSWTTTQEVTSNNTAFAQAIVITPDEALNPLHVVFDLSSAPYSDKSLVKYVRITVKGLTGGATGLPLEVLTGTSAPFNENSPVNVLTTMTLPMAYGDTVVCANVNVAGSAMRQFAVDFFQSDIVTAGNTYFIDSVSVELAWDPTFVVTAQTKFPTVGQSVGAAPNAWGTPQAVTAKDGVYSTILAANSAAGNDYIQSTIYNFNVPSDASVLGVRADFTILATAGVFANTVQLIKAGVRTGQNKGSGSDGGTSFGFGTSANTVSYGGPGDLWNLTFTPAEINDASFGVAYRPVRTGGAATRKVQMDSTPITVFFSEPPTVVVGPTNRGGFESQSVGLVRVYNVVALGAEFGYDASSPFASNHTPENLYGYESSSPGITKNVVVQSAEFGYTVDTPTMTQLHILVTLGAEFGFDAQSVPTLDPFYKSGWEAASVALLQISELRVQSMEFGWELDGAINYYDSTRMPANSKYGFDSDTVHLTQIHFITPADAEFGMEVEGIHELRIFGGRVPSRRITPVQQGKRVNKVIFQDRTYRV